MCGIGALIRLEESNEQIIRNTVNNMFLELQKKGEHASGICAIYPDHEEIVKKPLKADLFIKTNEFKDFMTRNWHARVFLIHCRHATKGPPEKNYNNHPLESNNFILLHNGIISDGAEDMFDKLDIVKWNPEIETDSYFINKVAEIYGIEAIPNVKGSMAIIMYDKSRKRLIIFRNQQNLNVGYSEDSKILAIATTESAIESALGEKKYLFGIIEVEDGEHEIQQSEIPTDVMFITGIDGINFERCYSSKEFHDEEIEGLFDDYYDTVAMKIGNFYAIKFKQDLNNKIKKAVETAQFQKKNGVFMLSSKEVQKLITIIAKHKEQRTKESLRDWDNWGRHYG